MPYYVNVHAPELGGEPFVYGIGAQFVRSSRHCAVYASIVGFSVATDASTSWTRTSHAAGRHGAGAAAPRQNRVDRARRVAARGLAIARNIPSIRYSS